MTTEDGPPAPGDRAKVVTKLPYRASVLVRASAPPEVPTERCVDARPGPFATFDGDRLRMSLSVSTGGKRRRFERDELPAFEDAVVAFLRDGGSAVASDGERAVVDGRDRPVVDGHEPPVVDEREPRVVRFGDRAACRRLLPTPSVDAIERRLGAAASRGSATLLTWTSDDPRPADYRTYDVVLNRTVTPSD